MLSNLFLMIKRFVTFAEELLLQKRSVTDAEQFVSHEKEICYFCGRSYSYRTDLLQMLSQLFLMRKRFVTFAEGVTLTGQICYKC